MELQNATPTVLDDFSILFFFANLYKDISIQTGYYLSRRLTIFLIALNCI